MGSHLTPHVLFSNYVKTGMAKQVDTRDPSQLSMSSLGHCARQLAYRHHGVTGVPISWRGMSIFEDGDMHHDMVRYWLEETLNPKIISDPLAPEGKKVLFQSCYALESQEESVDLVGIPGHIDGILRHDDVRCKAKDHPTYLLEVKSMNDRAFKELVKEQELSLEYRCQVSGYLAALGLKTAIIAAKNKNDSNLEFFTYDVEEDLVEQRLDVFQRVMESEEPESIEREFTPSKSGRLPWQCGYCPFAQTCWRDFHPVEGKSRKLTINMDEFLRKLHPSE